MYNEPIKNICSQHMFDHLQIDKDTERKGIGEKLMRGRKAEEKMTEMPVRRTGSTRKKTAHQTMLKKTVFLLAAAVILGSGFFGNTLMNVMAEPPAEAATAFYYKGIVIEEGDTLWSIASEYASETGLSVPDYIQLLKQMNGLYTDTIHAGHHLTVRYRGS